METILGGQPSTRMIVSLDPKLEFQRTHPILKKSVFAHHGFATFLTDTNDALHYYSHDNAITTNGVLNITTEQKENLYKAFNEKTKKFYIDSKYIQSAMLQGWNKFCITGGIVEFSAKLPGDPSTGGLWPACKFAVTLSIAVYFVLVNDPQ